MFENLVESGSHTGDITRKGSFFLITTLIYGVLLLAAFVTTIFLYDAHLDNQNLELTTLVAPIPVQPTQPDQPKEQPKPQEQPQERQVATRTELIADVTDTRIPKEVSVIANKVPPIPRGQQVQLGATNTTPAAPAFSSGPIGAGTGGSGPVVADDPPPPPPKPTPEPPKRTAPISGGVLNGKAISKPVPPYPAIAKAARAAGTVTVQITVDESGKVISAKAVSGHPLLLQAAQQAAYQARFSPTMLSGQPVKVSGIITYNFVLQ